MDESINQVFLDLQISPLKYVCVCVMQILALGQSSQKSLSENGINYLCNCDAFLKITERATVYCVSLLDGLSPCYLTIHQESTGWQITISSNTKVTIDRVVADGDPCHILWSYILSTSLQTVNIFFLNLTTRTVMQSGTAGLHVI